MPVRIEKIEMQGFKSFAKKIKLVLPSNFTVICGPNGSGKSAKWDTEIILSDGSVKPIGDIVNSALKGSKNIKKMDDGVYTTENALGIKTWGLDPKSMKIVEKDISAFIKREGEPHLFEIQTRIGKTVTTTGCHPVMIFRDGKIVSEVVSKLKKGDMISTPRKLDFDIKELILPRLNGKISRNFILLKDTKRTIKLPKKINKDFSRFLGYLVGDGYIVKGTRCDFVNADNELIDDFTLMGKRLGAKLSIYNYKKQGKVKMLSVYSKSLSNYIIKLMGGKYIGKDKHIPSQILFSRKSILANFLAALFDCDASIRKDNPTFEYVTKSEKLANQVQLALLRFGIVARKKVKIKYATNTKKKIKRKYYSIVVEGKEKLKLFYDNIPLKCRHKKKLIKRWATGRVVPNPNVDVIPKETNKLIIECRKLLGIEYKPLRKKYPRFAAYNENRCCLTREGILEAISIFDKRLYEINKHAIRKNKKSLVGLLKLLKILRREADIGIGVKKNTINNWYYGRYKNKSKNMINDLYDFLKKEIKIRKRSYLEKRKILKNLSNSDIFWDKIERIQKVKGEKYVYDLTIPNCHNFIGNGIFVHNSNVLDAVCFVLGRKSAKSLRAGRMMEMIFSGGTKTKGSDFAKVALTFNNKEKIFPLDDEKVEVSRRVNQKGVSIYQLNGKTVTREKILEVIRKANIHPDGYNIILQGDVTEIIEMSARERREIIDEVSGIAEFDEKRDKARNEILKVEDRLKSSGIILEEREKNLLKLKDEAQAARQYEKLALELDEYRASLAKKKLRDAEKAMSLLSEKIKKKEADAEKFTSLLNDIDNQLSDKQKKIKDLGESLIDRSKDLSLIKELEKMRSDIYSNRNKIETHESSIKRINEIIERLGEIKDDTASRAVKTVLALKKRGVYGTISGLSQVDTKYQTAIEVCAGGHMHDVITDSKEIAIDCINHLKSRKIGRATFLPLDKIKERDSSRLKKFIGKPGVVGVAIDLIKFDKKQWHAFSFVFGGTLVVDKIETARGLGIGRARFVTLDGDLVERSGAIIGGFYRKDRKIFSPKGDIDKYKKEKVSLQNEIAFLTKENGELTKKLEKLSTKEEKGEGRAEKMNKERLELEKALEIIRNRRRKTYDSKLVAQDSLNRLKINRARLEAELENAKAEFDTVDRNLQTHRLDFPDLKRKISELARDIQKLGPINQKAIQEYDLLRKLHSELREKVDVLAKERGRILQMITEIEARRKAAFLETLHQVAKHFSEVFHDIMGGHGTLELEGDDLDEAGLIIKATPPGRKSLNIDLMSGGQKTLTALAFLFAIQQFKPAPFYILDEVDAALDKPNSKKIVDLVMKYRERAQFVVITHNDTTIHAADCVYGVSMEEGISNMVGIRMP